MESTLEDQLKNFFQLIKEGRTEEIYSTLSENPVIDSPVAGRFEGNDSVNEYLLQKKKWLDDYNATVDPFSTIVTNEAIVVEYNFFISVEGKTKDLPVAIVGMIERDSVKEIRIYYSTWPLYGKHSGRRPILEENPGLLMPDIVRDYMNAISGTDAEAVVKLFTESGYIREPSGSEFTHIGEKGLRGFYSSAISGGGIPLKHCTCFTDGTRTAVEYNFSEWNGVKFPPEAGIAVYVTGNEGRLLAARVYDDADPSR